MRIIFDSRVLYHEKYTGVENYTKNILNYMKPLIELKEVSPKFKNKYFSHLWSHLIMPYKTGDVLFCPANIAPAFIPKDKKLIITIHDVAFLTHPNSYSMLFKKYYKLLMPINIKRADKIITVSEFSKNEIMKYYPDAKNKIEVIYLGVDKTFKRLNTTRKKNQILYVGSLSERKNFSGVIKAFELLNNKSLKLIIVGNFSDNFTINDYNKRILVNALKNKNIEFKQNVNNNELVKIYNESKLLIFPSFYEGFGLPVVEAFACGTPVITSNVSSLPEIGRDSAIYCNPYNIEDIKNKIELVLNNRKLQKLMIEKGIQRAKEFEWEKVAIKHIEVIYDLLQ